MSPTSTSDDADPPRPPALPAAPATTAAVTPATAPVTTSAATSAAIPATRPTTAPPTAPPTAPSTRRLLTGFLGDLLLASLALIAASFLLVVPLVAVAALRQGGIDPDDLPALQQQLMPQITAASVAAMLLAGLVVWWFRGRRLPSPATPMRAIAAYPMAVVAGVAIQAACLALVMLSEATGTELVPSNADPVEQLARQSPWLAWVTVVVLAPLAEELLFRHVLLRRFAAAGRAVTGIVVTSLLFAAMHELVPGVPSWSAWLSALALFATMGAGFGTVYLVTGRLGAAVVAHAACNLAAMSMAAFSPL